MPGTRTVAGGSCDHILPACQSRSAAPNACPLLAVRMTRRPRTGRTHQIRVHLQHLGHPIANDAQYGGTYPGPLPPRALARELGVSWEERRSGGGAELAAQEQQHGRGLQQQLAADVEVPPALRDPLCPHCPLFPPVDFPLDMRPLWLHAQRYACADGEWSFSAELPEWAQREYVPPPLEGAAQERQG